MPETADTLHTEISGDVRRPKWLSEKYQSKFWSPPQFANGGHFPWVDFWGFLGPEKKNALLATTLKLGPTAYVRKLEGQKYVT